MKLSTAQLKLIRKYNGPDTIALVTPYPIFEDGIKTNTSGIDAYSYHLAPSLASLLEGLERKLIIIADVKDKKQKVSVDSNGILVIPVWKRNSIRSYFQIRRTFSELNKVNNIYIHFDFNVYGEAFVTSLFPLLLLSLKRRNVTLLAHSVAESITSLSGHLGINNKVEAKVLDFIHHRFHFTMALLSKKIVVHDNVLKDRLSRITKKPIFVIPIGMGEFKHKPSVALSRANLGFKQKDFLILCFGFLTWYKGSDWIIDLFIDFFKKHGESNAKLVMAGGPSANLKDKLFYKNYYNKQVEKVRNFKNIFITGFVPEAEVPYYYSASDIVVLPYRTQMSASAPFALALGFDKPFLLSNELSGVLETNDIKANIKELDINKSELLFNMKNQELFKKIVELESDKKQLKKLSQLSTETAINRHWSKHCEKLLLILDA